MTDDQKQIRELKRALRKFVNDVSECINGFDVVCKEPTSFERGRKLGRIVAALQMAYDYARLFGLGESLTKRRKAVVCVDEDQQEGTAK